MYGLHQTLTRRREDGLAWKVSIDRISGEWLPTLLVVDIAAAMQAYPKLVLAALNGTSVAVRSQMYARKLLHSGFTGNLLDEILDLTTRGHTHA